MAARLGAAGGANFSAVAQLTYRQVFGAQGWAWTGSALWSFQKEISSDGDMSTLDVIFPAAPQLLAVAAGAPLRALLDPVLFEMASFDPSLRYTQPCALHSLGKWPVVDAGNGGCSMPMESTGDAILLAAAATQAAGGDAGWLAPYMPLMRTFADFCNGALPFPAPQDMTDDFSHAPGNLTNLALKCLIAIGAEGYLEQAAGNATGAAARYASAAAAGAFFAQHAWAGDHFQFIYNETWRGSYGLMYNAFWARLLGLEGLVPNFNASFGQHFEFLGAVTANATWCTPLSSMEHDSKWDWLAMTAALTLPANGSAPAPGSSWPARVFDQLFFFANATSSRFPLTDHPSCVGAFPPAAAADRARPVLGAFFAPLLIAQPSAAVAGQRAAIRAASAAWWQH